MFFDPGYEARSTPGFHRASVHPETAGTAKGEGFREGDKNACGHAAMGEPRRKWARTDHTAISHRAGHFCACFDATRGRCEGVGRTFVILRKPLSHKTFRNLSDSACSAQPAIRAPGASGDAAGRHARAPVRPNRRMSCCES